MFLHRTPIIRWSHAPIRWNLASSRVLSALVCGAVSVYAAACANTITPQTALYDRLSDRGPILLDSENPYLPAERLLSEEMKASAEVREFIAQRGMPEAISVTKGILSRTELAFFYPGEREYYSLTKKRQGWVIGAPEPIGEDELVALRTEKSFGAPNDHGSNDQGSKWADAYQRDFGGEERAPGEATYRASLSRTARLNDIPVVSGNSQGRASVQVLRNGNLLHTVTFPGETLSLIALWYTGAASNMGPVARASKISSRELLKKGDVLTIPRNLLRTRKALGQADLRRLMR